MRKTSKDFQRERVELFTLNLGIERTKRKFLRDKLAHFSFTKFLMQQTLLPYWTYVVHTTLKCWRSVFLKLHLCKRPNCYEFFAAKFLRNPRRDPKPYTVWTFCMKLRIFSNFQNYLV